VTRRLPSSFDGFTHVICDDTTSISDVKKALGSSNVNLVIVVDSLKKELCVEVPVDFRLVTVKVHGKTEQYAMYMRVHGVQQPPSPRLISVPSRSFHPSDVNVLPTKFNVDHSAPPNFEMIKDGLKHTVLANVAATMYRPNGTVTYMPGEYLRLQVDRDPRVNDFVSVTYRGIVQSGQSDSVILYEDTRGNIGAAPPNQVRGLHGGGKASSNKMTSEEIAEGVRAWLKEDVVKRNLTGEFSSKVTLIPLITALIITLITPNNPNNPNNGPNII
jgi:hypothetical protein